jgi:hypothetical protein
MQINNCDKKLKVRYLISYLINNIALRK